MNLPYDIISTISNVMFYLTLFITWLPIIFVAAFVIKFITEKMK